MGRFSPTVHPDYYGPNLGVSLGQLLEHAHDKRLEWAAKEDALAAAGVSPHGMRRDRAPTIEHGAGGGSVFDPQEPRRPTFAPQRGANPGLHPFAPQGGVQGPPPIFEGAVVPSSPQMGPTDLGSALGEQAVLPGFTPAPVRLPGDTRSLLGGLAGAGAAGAVSVQEPAQEPVPGVLTEQGIFTTSPHADMYGNPRFQGEGKGGHYYENPGFIDEQIPEVPHYPAPEGGYGAFAREPRRPRGRGGWQSFWSGNRYDPADDMREAGRMDAFEQEADRYGEAESLYEQLLAQGHNPAEAYMIARSFAEGRDDVVRDGFFDPNSPMQEGFQNRTEGRTHVRTAQREAGLENLEHRNTFERTRFEEGAETGRTRIREQGAMDRLNAELEARRTGEFFAPGEREDPNDPLSGFSAVERREYRNTLIQADKINNALSMVEEVPEAFGPLDAMVPHWMRTPEHVEAQQAVMAVSAQLVRELAGSAATESEMRRIRSYTVNESDTAAQARVKLEGLAREVAARLAQYGASYPTGSTRSPFHESSESDPTVDYFNRYNLERP